MLKHVSHKKLNRSAITMSCDQLEDVSTSHTVKHFQRTFSHMPVP